MDQMYGAFSKSLAFMDKRAPSSEEEGGDEWVGGNLSYHLKSRPIWYEKDGHKIKELIDMAARNRPEDGVLIIWDVSANCVEDPPFVIIKNKKICMYTD